MKKLGVVGGMGPAASALFYENLIEFTDAEKDQQHIDVVLFSCASIPDRTNFLLENTTDSPVPVIKKVIADLVKCNIEYVAIPCITAHCFYSELVRDCPVPLINIIQETVNVLYTKKIKSACVLSTTGTARNNLFQDEFKKNGIEYIQLNTNEQEEVMQLIYSIKSGSINYLLFQSIIQKLKKKNVCNIVLGCTELSYFNKFYDSSIMIFDCIQILAIKALTLCDARVKKDILSKYI
ncbi:MAG: amino acid racemase [Bacteroidales bacterium]|jgi:aspartate racemase|nr:amino acid racemase [Bacteroidales bacterium]